MICLYPDCPNTSRTRGLCHGHYQTMRDRVRKGRAQEADLEARGLLTPKGTGGTKAVGSDAFELGSGVRGRRQVIETGPGRTHAQEQELIGRLLRHECPRCGEANFTRTHARACGLEANREDGAKPLPGFPHPCLDEKDRS